jgi:hypothetical protein
MSFIHKDKDPNPIARLRVSVRKMQNAIDHQITAVHDYKDNTDRLAKEMREIHASMKCFSAALARINIRGVGIKSRQLAAIMSR